MAESQNSLTAAADKFGVPVNVGARGGDLPARYLAALALSALTAEMWLGASMSTIKIGALLIGMAGTVLLMAGLVFSQTTHFAGILLTLLPFLMLALTAWGVRWLGILLGVAFVASILYNIASKRCGVNKLLGIVSVEQEEACATDW